MTKGELTPSTEKGIDERGMNEYSINCPDRRYHGTITEGEEAT
jgi:hypothetical protein